jgi:predicted HTH domain antitoxin
MPSGAEASPHLDVRLFLHDADVDISEEQLQHIQEDLRAVVAARLYANRQVSMGKAAELCGLTVAEFVEKLAEWHIPVIQYPIDQLRHDRADR